MQEGPESFAVEDNDSGPSCYDSETFFLPDAGAGLASSGHSAHGNFIVNQVEIPFIPLRSTLEPSHTANEMGTEAPALNWVSFASLVSSERFTTIRQVGPTQQPPLTEPAGSHTPLPFTSWWAWVVNVLNPLAFRSSTELTRRVGSDMMFPDQIPELNGPRLRPIRSG